MSTSVDTQTIRQQYELAHSPAKVWRALTEPKLLASWLMQTDMKPEVGASFTFRTEPSAWWDGIVHCEVLEMDAMKRISYTWRSGPEASPLDTVVTWTLTPLDGGGTRLDLEHSGFVRKNKFAFEGAESGWKRNVEEKMTAVLESV